MICFCKISATDQSDADAETFVARHRQERVIVARPGSDRPAASVLADFATRLRFEDIPAAAIDKARDCLIDAVACALFGRNFPWSRIILAEAAASGGGGVCTVPGMPEGRLHLPQAALVLGSYAHAFELDSLRKPGAGVHPGATVALPALAAAQAGHASGRDLLAAIVAGCEVMFRIGAATLHTPEKQGFHAPGLTGPFGSATACGRLMGLTGGELCSAYGIAGSLAGGLLAFSRAGGGGMVKRLHLGRAAEGGVLAARLAMRGFEGPPTVLDGGFGLLDAYCDESDPRLLTAELGETWQMETLCLKPYACHVTAQAPIHFLRTAMRDDSFTADDIAGIEIAASAKVASHHSARQPCDVMGAQYSVPFSVAIAAHADPDDPASFSADMVSNVAVRDLADRIAVVERGSKAKGWGADIAIRLKHGRLLTGVQETFPGCPETPFDAERLRTKFDKLAGDLQEGRRDALFGAFRTIEERDDVALLLNNLW